MQLGGVFACCSTRALQTNGAHFARQDNVDIIIATPGRLMQHLTQTDLSLNMVSMCVFDEADR